MGRQADVSWSSIGMIDEPEKQSQTPIAYQIMDDGNIGVFGSSGYGKSNTLLTIFLGISENVISRRSYIFIFSIMAMDHYLPLKQLPHTADYFTIDEELKRDKLIKRIKEEIARRKFHSNKQK